MAKYVVAEKNLKKWYGKNIGGAATDGNQALSLWFTIL